MICIWNIHMASRRLWAIFFRRSVCMRVVHNRVVEKMNVALFSIADTNDRKKKKKTQIHDFRSNGPAEKKQPTNLWHKRRDRSTQETIIDAYSNRLVDWLWVCQHFWCMLFDCRVNSDLCHKCVQCDLTTVCSTL